jgi:hypothetical protein
MESFFICGYHRYKFSIDNVEISYFFFEQHFPSQVCNVLPHGSNDLRQLISAYMGMCIIKDLFIGTEVNEQA